MAFDTQHSMQDATDFVVMGSDGLFDNIHDQDLIPCLKNEI
jgi:serine/threonine protein phosphatase PrpC